MAILEIKIEKNPQRCDVCHQTDKYDPVANFCSRCRQLNTDTKDFGDLRFSNVTSIVNKYFLINCFNGYLAAYLFEFITHYPGFELFFFYRQEKFLIPNWKYFLCAAMIIPLGLFVGLIVNRRWNDINLFRHRIACYVFLPITIFITGIIGIKVFFLAAMIFTPLMMAIIEALVLWFVTKRWYWHLFILMISSIFIAYLLACIGFKVTGYGNQRLFYCAFLTGLYFQWASSFSKEKSIYKNAHNKRCSGLGKSAR